MNEYIRDLAQELDDAARHIDDLAKLHGLTRDQDGHYVQTGTPIGDDAIERAFDTEIEGISLEYNGRAIIRIAKLMEDWPNYYEDRKR